VWLGKGPAAGPLHAVLGLRVTEGGGVSFLIRRSTVRLFWSATLALCDPQFAPPVLQVASNSEHNRHVHLCPEQDSNPRGLRAATNMSQDTRSPLSDDTTELLLPAVPSYRGDFLMRVSNRLSCDKHQTTCSERHSLPSRKSMEQKTSRCARFCS
jgi:hypothetical protein